MIKKVKQDPILADLRQLFKHLLSKIKRRGVFIPLLIALIGVSTFAGWKTGFFAELYFQYNRAEIMVVVEDSKTGRPLVGISIEANGQMLKTDEQGTVFFERLQMGETTFKISLPGFKDFFQTSQLNRGPNLELVFSLQIATAKLSGTAVAYVDGTPIAGAKVIAAGAEATTGKDGKFILEEVIIGTPEVTISRNGYYDFSQTVELTKNVIKSIGELKLLAKGRVVFVSNRDGKNAIYWAKLDGSGSGKIWENKGGFDDTSPYLSPDKQKIIFLSNRDNQKDEDGNLRDLLYYNDISGKSLQKLSSGVNPRLHGWLANGSGFVYEIHFGNWEEGWYSEIKIVEVPALTAPTLASTQGADFGTSAQFGFVALSPKSDWIAFNVAVSDASNKMGIYLIRLDGTGLKKISSTPLPWSLDMVEFSKDGKRVVYKRYDSSNYYAYDIATGTTAKTSTPKGLGGIYSRQGLGGIYSSAQKLWAFVDYHDGGSNTNIYVSKKDGTAERRVTFAGWDENCWGVEVYFAGPNDRYLVYSASVWSKPVPSTESAIYVIGLKEGSKPLKVIDIANVFPSGFAGIVPE